MHIVHLCGWRIPVDRYGGSQRVAYWVAKAQVELGQRVTLIAPPGSTCPGTEVIEIRNGVPAAQLVPADADVVHVHGTSPAGLSKPWVLTTHGNSPGELAYAPQKIFVSADHARRAGSRVFVHNGIDPAEFIYRERKDDYVLFLSKVSRRSKGIDVALRLARRLGFRLLVAGGTRFGLRKTGGLVDSLLGDVHFLGEVGGVQKAELFAGARALLFPIRWEEPFGLVVAEALMSGTPVVTTARGAMPELLTPQTGFLCSGEDEMAAAIRKVDLISPAACRAHAMRQFTHLICATKYLHYYERAIRGEPLEQRSCVITHSGPRLAGKDDHGIETPWSVPELAR